MANFSQLIKTAAGEYINSTCPTAVVTGILTSFEPIEIKISDKEKLNKSFLCFSKTVMTGLSEKDIGKKLILISEQGGQMYYAIDWLVEL